jgi:uroporphyrinogen-III decarboxylase
VKYHACGNTKALLPFFSKLGADIINLDSLIDLKEAKLILRNNVCIKGILAQLPYCFEEAETVKSSSTMHPEGDCAGLHPQSRL